MQRTVVVETRLREPVRRRRAVALAEKNVFVRPIFALPELYHGAHEGRQELQGVQGGTAQEALWELTTPCDPIDKTLLDYWYG